MSVQIRSDKVHKLYMVLVVGGGGGGGGHGINRDFFYGENGKTFG